MASRLLAHGAAHRNGALRGTLHNASLSHAALHGSVLGRVQASGRPSARKTAYSFISSLAVTDLFFADDHELTSQYSITTSDWKISARISRLEDQMGKTTAQFTARETTANHLYSQLDIKPNMPSSRPNMSTSQPTSPTFANICIARTNKIFAELNRKMDWQYYSSDLTFRAAVSHVISPLKTGLITVDS
jgi:hypothetical protein